jgi:hypothetical protein
MGRHHRPDDTTESLARPQLVMTVPGPTPAAPPAPVIEPIGPPLHVGWRERRTLRRQQAEATALAARIARAQRRLRQVTVAPGVVPSIPSPRPAADAGPPWRSELPAPGEPTV